MSPGAAAALEAAMNGDVRLTSEILWRATIIAVCVDAPLVILVGRLVSSELFGKLKWHLAAAAFIIYAALWGSYGSVYFWDAATRTSSRPGHGGPCRSEWARCSAHSPSGSGA